MLNAAFEVVIKRNGHMSVFVKQGYALLPVDVKAAAKEVCISIAKIEKAKISL